MGRVWLHFNQLILKRIFCYKIKHNSFISTRLKISKEGYEMFLNDKNNLNSPSSFTRMFHNKLHVFMAKCKIHLSCPSSFHFSFLNYSWKSMFISLCNFKESFIYELYTTVYFMCTQFYKTIRQNKESR